MTPAMFNIPEHTFRHGKDHFNWSRSDTAAKVAEAQRVRTVEGSTGGFLLSLFRRHSRAQTWAQVDDAIFLFAGRVCVAIYRHEGEIHRYPLTRKYMEARRAEEAGGALE